MAKCSLLVTVFRKIYAHLCISCSHNFETVYSDLLKYTTEFVILLNICKSSAYFLCCCRCSNWFYSTLSFQILMSACPCQECVVMALAGIPRGHMSAAAMKDLHSLTMLHVLVRWFALLLLKYYLYYKNVKNI